MILTRRIFTWTLRPPRPSPPPQPREQFPPQQQTKRDALPIEAALHPNEPVSTFLFQRAHVNFSPKRRECDPPNRYLQLTYGLVEPFSAAASTSSNPRAMGALKRWYQMARKWGVLHSDYRTPVTLPQRNRLQLQSNRGYMNVKREPLKGSAPLLMDSRWARALGRSPRVIVIGDVHGCVTEFQELLRLADFTPGDQVVLLGDLVAKGPDSVSVVKLAREIGARTVRGNHDYEVVRWWEAHVRGDSNAMVSVEHARIARALGPDEHSWLLESPWFIECADMGHLFVHAGFIPGVKLTQQNPRLMMNMRSVLQDGTVTAKNVNDCEWAKLWKGPQTVVFGHDAFRGLQLHEFAKGIDTGCVYGGRLTALLLPENRLISVAARRAYISPRRFRARTEFRV